jgi:hypothetical protein
VLIIVMMEQTSNNSIDWKGNEVKAERLLASKNSIIIFYSCPAICNPRNGDTRIAQYRYRQGESRYTPCHKDDRDVPNYLLIIETTHTPRCTEETKNNTGRMRRRRRGGNCGMPER